MKNPPAALVERLQSELDRPFKTALVDDGIGETLSLRHEIRMAVTAAKATLGLKNRPSLQGRVHSVMKVCFRKAKLQRQLYGDELGEG